MDWEWLLVLGGYALGTFPSALLVGRYTGHDPTREGSNNPGASNTYRVAGRWPAAWVLVSDVGKGVVAAGLGLTLGGRLLAVACGVAAVVGHIVPLGRYRQGGKGVATFGGMLLMLTPLVGVILIGVWATVLVVTRRASGASLGAVLAAPAAVAIQGWSAPEVGVVIGCAVVVVVRHYENIRRIWRREEPAIWS
ncbi:glycerol-3-phosphate acyltransferase [Candidatus Poriferisocius sp.]|uniref:glycerol-3-phosphate acyltransferase n=1 Tax=Candidatus Poriferisocius sp. TaxID=3101276 RepID=UPI003B01BF96